MITAIESVQTELASVVGASHVVTEPAVCQSFAVDGQSPQSVVYPQSAEQVAAVLKYAADHGLAVIPCRNATKLGIGNCPRRYDIALSLKDLNNVWHYEPADLTASVEPGVKLGDLQHLLERSGLWLPLDPAGGERASLGGIVATNASGPLRMNYGAPRDMVVGMKIAIADGKIVKTGGRVVKNVAGYDLAKLLIGSYGSLGVMVEVSLKLFPLPVGRATFVLRAQSLEAARELRRRIADSPLSPMRMVLMGGEAATLIAESRPGGGPAGELTVWFETGGSQRVLDRYARALEEIGRVAGASISRVGADEARLGWKRLVDFRSCFAEAWPDVAILKAALPMTASEDFVRHAQQECERANSRLAVFAQPAVGVVHVCLLDGSGSANIVPLIEELRRAAQALRGALVVERCSPEVKSRVDVWGPPSNDFEIMRKLKRAWDPRGTLSPGRFVGCL